MTFIAAVVISSLLHECGHGLAAGAFGVRVKSFGVNIWGCYVVRERTVGWREVSICLAGVAVNLLLAMSSTGFFRTFNLAMVFVNLLPIKGSDGRNAYFALRQKPLTA